MIGTMRKSVHTQQYRALRDFLTALRGSASLSQRDLAAMLEVPHSWVAKVESGERRIDLLEFYWFVEKCGGDPAASAAEVFASFAGTPSRNRARTGRR